MSSSGQEDLQRPGVLPHVLRRPGLRDRADAPVPHDPRQCDLCRRHAVAGGDALQRRVAEEPALLDRRVGHDRQLAALAPRQEVELDSPAREVVEDLIGRHRVAARQGDELDQVGRVEVADAPVADQPGALQLAERPDVVRQRHRAAPVQEVEVEVVRVQPLQARHAGGERPVERRVLGEDLADEEDVVAAPGDRPADEPFAGAGAVHLGGVDEGHAQVEAGPQRSDLDVGRMAAVAEMPRTHAEDGDRLFRREVDRAHRGDRHTTPSRTRRVSHQPPDSGGHARGQAAATSEAISRTASDRPTPPADSERQIGKSRA